MEIIIDKDMKLLFNKVIINPDISSIQQASYDLRVGEEVYFSERGEKINLKEKEAVIIKPFESIVIKTLEKIKMPKNMFGIVFLRSKLATRGFVYTGGVIDPGYHGYLWLNLRNMSPRHEEIVYKQTIATLILIKLDREVEKGYSEIYGEIDLLPQDRRPPIPERTLYDWIELSKKIDEMSSKINEIKFEVSRVHQILIGLVYACVAGIIAGLIVTILSKMI